MTLNIDGYTVGANRSLACARILWNMIRGAVSGEGEPELALTDDTSQRWIAGGPAQTWTLEAPADAELDTVMIAAHNLGSIGATVAIQTSATMGGAFTTRATVTPPDNSTIAVMFNTAGGSAHTVRRVRLSITGASAPIAIGIIRAGCALQMPHPVFGGVRPFGLSRVTEAQMVLSERGQWLGRTGKFVAMAGQVEWSLLPAAWYRASFEPFARTLPLHPFGLILNAEKMPESVGWCWTDADAQPGNSGVLDFVSVGLSFTVFGG